jgi:predicted kinase
MDDAESLAVETRRALDAEVERFSSGMLVIWGFPASGKSTAARYLASRRKATLLDKDSFAPALENAVMHELTGNPHDRDSAMYRRVVGPNIYDALTRTALRVAHHGPVVVDGPFLEYIRVAAARTPRFRT